MTPYGQVKIYNNWGEGTARSQGWEYWVRVLRRCQRLNWEGGPTCRCRWHFFPNLPFAASIIHHRCVNISVKPNESHPNSCSTKLFLMCSIPSSWSVLPWPRLLLLARHPPPQDPSLLVLEVLYQASALCLAFCLLGALPGSPPDD